MDEEHGPADAAPFPTFFMGGFECSTFVWKDGQRKDYVVLTGHDRQLEGDYQRLVTLGIGAVREAVRWPVVDRGGGRYDWSTVDVVLEGLARFGLTPIWDLFHYGLPDGCHPLEHGCLERFTDYCRAVAEHVVPRTEPPRFFTPVNEITFFSDACTDMGWMYPFARGRHAEVKRELCRMAIAAVKSIRQLDPGARMVHVDPLIHEVAPPGRPDLAEEAREDTYEKTYEAWDMLYGRLAPELGGAPEVLDIVGVNVYHLSQSVLEADERREALGPRDPRRWPLGRLLEHAFRRYRRPIIIGETSGYADHRAEWLRTTVQESLRAVDAGVELRGICLYPVVDIPDWNTGRWAKIGIFDVEDRPAGRRLPCEPYVAELRRWQRILERPGNLGR